MAQTFLKAIPLQSFNTAGLIVTYLPINAAGLPAACSMVEVLNDSAVDVYVSFDGVNDHRYLPHGSELFLPAQFLRQPRSEEALMAKGTIVFVRGAAAGAGFVYLSAYYV